MRPDRSFVLYWMTAARRTTWSHGLQHAVWHAQQLGLPLVVLEAIRVEGRWASRRVHRFVLQGMADNAVRFGQFGICYHPYVEPTPGHASGLLQALANDAAVVVTDLFPTHFHPRMLAATQRRLDVRVEAVDGLGIIPVGLPKRDFTVAHSFRRWTQKNLPQSWDPPMADPLVVLSGGVRLADKILARWPAVARMPTGEEALPVSLNGTPSAVATRGGEKAARAAWRHFHTHQLHRYPRDRSHPDDAIQSGLSAWLHFGHIGAYEVFHDVAPTWDPSMALKATGSRAGWWGLDEDVEAFLDQLLTWRELGAVQAHRDLAGFTSYAGLPSWARTTLAAHRQDARPELYTIEQLEGARTSDPLWNAAQRELVRDGQMHNALRMLWGKKVLGWTEDPERAFEILVQLNNQYALDGRDPNSWSGIGWVFGKFDRAWGPERPIFGKVRYMTSASSRRKWRLSAYLRQHSQPL